MILVSVLSRNSQLHCTMLAVLPKRALLWSVVPAEFDIFGLARRAFPLSLTTLSLKPSLSTGHPTRDSLRNLLLLALQQSL